MREVDWPTKKPPASKTGGFVFVLISLIDANALGGHGSQGVTNRLSGHINLGTNDEGTAGN